jgi:hypothetical protein
MNDLTVLTTLTDNADILNQSVCTGQRALELMNQYGAVCTMPAEIDKLVLVTGLFAFSIGVLACLGFQYMRKRFRKNPE